LLLWLFLPLYNLMLIFIKEKGTNTSQYTFKYSEFKFKNGANCLFSIAVICAVQKWIPCEKLEEIILQEKMRNWECKTMYLFIQLPELKLLFAKVKRYCLFIDWL
jgi:hypothetical protein